MKTLIFTLIALMTTTAFAAPNDPDGPIACEKEAIVGALSKHFENASVSDLFQANFQIEDLKSDQNGIPTLAIVKQHVLLKKGDRIIKNQTFHRLYNIQILDASSCKVKAELQGTEQGIQPDGMGPCGHEALVAALAKDAEAVPVEDIYSASFKIQNLQMNKNGPREALVRRRLRTETPPRDDSFFLPYTFQILDINQCVLIAHLKAG